MARRKAKKNRKRSATGESSAQRAPSVSGCLDLESATGLDAPARSGIPATPAYAGTTSDTNPSARFALGMPQLPSEPLPPAPAPREQLEVSQEELDAMMRDYVADQFRKARTTAYGVLAPEVVPLANVLAKRAQTAAMSAEARDKADRLDRGAPTEITAQAWDASRYTVEELRELRAAVAKGTSS